MTKVASSIVSDKQLEQFRSVQKNCDHTKLTESTGNTSCCFCTKMMLVLGERSGISTATFAEQFASYMRYWHMKQPGFFEGLIKLREQMQKMGAL